MSNTANKARGEIAVPGAGDGAFLRFDVDALEKLEQALGEKYFDAILKDLPNARISTLKTCLEVGLVGADFKDVLAKVPSEISIDALNDCIFDGIFAAVYGRTFAEQREWEEKDLERRFKEAEEDPRKALYLSSMLSGAQATEQDSDQERSGASLQ